MERFLGKGVLIDTNLLLLFVVGQYDPGILTRGTFNRLASYTIDDFRLVRNLTLLFQTRVTTPHVLAEVSNWIGYLSRDQEIECLGSFSVFLESFYELPTDSFELSRTAEFPFLGLTDTALAAISRDFLVITDDARFIFHLNEMGREALNINHLRQERWLQNS